MRIRPQRRRLTVEQISFPLGVHMRQISFAQAAKVSEIKHVYEVRPRKDHRDVDLISDALSVFASDPARGLSLSR